MSTPLAATDLLPLTRLMLALDRQKRATLHEDGETFESVAAHTVMLAWVVVVFATEVGIRRRADGHHWHFNTEKALLYVLAHDLPEALAGDTCTARELSADAQAAKEAREADALGEIRRMLDHSSTAPIAGIVKEYEAQYMPEARFVRYLDKVLPKLTHALNGGAALKRLGMGLDEVMAEHRRQMAKLAEQYPEFPEVGQLLHEAGLLSEEALASSFPTELS